MALMNVLQIISIDVYDELNTVTDASKLHHADGGVQWEYVFP